METVQREHVTHLTDIRIHFVTPMSVTDEGWRAIYDLVTQALAAQGVTREHYRIERSTTGRKG